MKRIAVLGQPQRWSSRVLADEIEQRTGFRRLVDATQLHADFNRPALCCSGENLLDLDAIIIKKMGQAYGPEQLDRLELLRLAEAQGVRVLSPPERIMRLLDRLACTTTLRIHGIPMPPTLITESPEEAAEAARRYRHAILKPLYSTKARGMEVLDATAATHDHLLERIQAFQQAGNPVIYLQQMIDLPGRDLGLVFLGGQYLGAYARVGDGDAWNTTTRSGGKYAPADPPEDIVKLARRAQAPFGLDFTSVDVAETAEGPVIFEVSAFGGFRGLMEGCGIDAAARYADYALERIAHD